MSHRSNAIVGQPIYLVLMEDPIIHTTDNPYCTDSTCPCHEEEAISDEEIAAIMAAPSPLERAIEEGYSRIQRNVQRLIELL